jgi:hypothetical protein
VAAAVQHSRQRSKVVSHTKEQLSHYNVMCAKTSIRSVLLQAGGLD